MKRTLAIGGVVATLLLVPLGVADASPAGPGRAAAVTATPGQTCKDIGRYDIPRTDPDYRAELDRDKDGVACEQDEIGLVPVTAPAKDDGDGTSSSSSSENGDDGASASGTSSSSSGSSDGDDDQVSVVPDGGAPTGDGSTDGSSAPYWVGGGLAAVALLAAAGVTLRKRLFARS